MVAADDGVRQLARSLHGGVRVRAVADQIAEAQNVIILALRYTQALLKGLEIGVNVAQDQITQAQLPADTENYSSSLLTRRGGFTRPHGEMNSPLRPCHVTR